ncbi:MAG: AraC family transcriptional regulator [Bacteroidales bacterium]|nr:AraC family transcriptional regulator [Bacteroidales bacterium]
MKSHSKILPVMHTSTSVIKCTSWRNDLIRIAEIGDFSNANTPEYFHTNDYAILFITKGTLYGQINQFDAVMTFPSAVYIFNDHILHYQGNTPDLKMRILAYSPTIVEDLALQIPLDVLRYAYVRPVCALNKHEMQIIMYYLDLMEKLMHDNVPNRQTTIIQLIRSLMSFLFSYYTDSISLQKPLSRAEDITGCFLSLVDKHCQEYHTINWYASELCLSPKYIANVIKQVIGRTAGDCINEALIRQAKSLLLTSSLSVQQISDRLGFKNQSHFGTFFHRATGMSPLAFRMQNHLAF